MSRAEQWDLRALSTNRLMAAALSALVVMGSPWAQGTPRAANDDGAPSLSPDGKRVAFHSSRNGFRDIYVMDLDGGNQTRLTSGNRHEQRPRWSPDGSLITYQLQTAGGWKIYIMADDGSDAQELLDSPGMDPVWSPDGTRMLYAAPDRQGTWQLWETDLGGVDQVQLTESSRNKSKPAYSVDGSRIAYVLAAEAGPVVRVMDADGGRDSEALDVGSQGERRFVNGLSWTKDGKLLLCTNLGRDGLFHYSSAIYTMAPDGSKLKPVIVTKRKAHSRGMYSDKNAAMSADGKLILFESYRNGGSEIYSISANGKRLKNLTKTSSQHGYPSFADDGNRIVFSSGRDGNGEIYIMRRDGSKPVNLSRNPAEDRCPSVSHDGKRIAFVSFRDNAHGDLYVMGIDGKNVKRVTKDGFFAERDEFAISTAFAPDEKSLVFESAPVLTGPDSHWDIWSIDIDGKNPKRLTDTPGGRRSSYPAVSPDGKSILYSSSGTSNGAFQVFRMDMDGKNKRNLSSNRAQELYATWSRDGESIFYLSDQNGPRNIYLMDADGSGAVQLTEDSSVLDWPVMAPDEGTILIQSHGSGSQEIYALEGDQRTQLTHPVFP